MTKQLVKSIIDAKIAMFVKDQQGTYILANPQAATMAQRPLDQLIGANDFEIFERSSAELMSERDKQILDNNKLVSYKSVAKINNRWMLFHSVKVPITYRGSPALFGLSYLTGEKSSSETALRVLEQATSYLEQNAYELVFELVKNSSERATLDLQPAH